MRYLLLVVFLAGCSSTPLYTAEDYAYSDRMSGDNEFNNFVGRPMRRRQANDYDFFYKHCTQTDRPGGWSATSWDCTTGPF